MTPGIQPGAGLHGWSRPESSLMASRDAAGLLGIRGCERPRGLPGVGESWARGWHGQRTGARERVENRRRKARIVEMAARQLDPEGGDPLRQQGERVEVGLQVGRGRASR